MFIRTNYLRSAVIMLDSEVIHRKKSAFIGIPSSKCTQIFLNFFPILFATNSNRQFAFLSISQCTLQTFLLWFSLVNFGYLQELPDHFVNSWWLKYSPQNSSLTCKLKIQTLSWCTLQAISQLEYVSARKMIQFQQIKSLLSLSVLISDNFKIWWLHYYCLHQKNESGRKNSTQKRTLQNSAASNSYLCCY